MTDSEIQEWVFGDNPPEFLRRSFTDSTGRFDREMYRQVLSNPDQAIQDPDPSDGVDPRFGSKQLVLIEQQLRQQRLREKYLTSLTALHPGSETSNLYRT